VKLWEGQNEIAGQTALLMHAGLAHQTTSDSLPFAYITSGKIEYLEALQHICLQSRAHL